MKHYSKYQFNNTEIEIHYILKDDNLDKHQSSALEKEIVSITETILKYTHSHKILAIIEYFNS
jgi:hypothetical protein